MTEDLLAEFKGNIYQSLPNWRMKEAPFIVTKLLRHESSFYVTVAQVRTIEKHSRTEAITVAGIRKCKRIITV